jgi:hypothetical protein
MFKRAARRTSRASEVLTDSDVLIGVSTTQFERFENLAHVPSSSMLIDVFHRSKRDQKNPKICEGTASKPIFIFFFQTHKYRMRIK